MKLLAIDTASGQCSAALLADGRVLERGVLTPRDHAHLILPLVDELLAEAGTTLQALDGIAFGRGPGSFTGVRIAAAVVQGLAAGADLPVLPVSSLRALAAQASRRVLEAEGQPPAGAIAGCMDARMGEIYWAVYGPGLADATETVGPPQGLQESGLQVTAAAGKGMGAYPAIAASLQLPEARVFAYAEPHARDVATLAAADLAAGVSWIDAALAQPVYLRNQVAHQPKKC